MIFLLICNLLAVKSILIFTDLDYFANCKTHKTYRHTRIKRKNPKQLLG